MSQVSPELQSLQDDLFRSKVRRARQMTPDERMMEGLRLFDRGVSLMRDGIRAQHPEFDDAQVEREVHRRLAIAKRLDDAGLYRDAGVVSDDD
ncbi:MAG: hypothetical protein ACKV2Q_16390 [Planctomycetaceae bacterium]